MGVTLTENDREYFLRRAAEERTAASGATHPLAESAHLELATWYDRMAEGVTVAPVIQMRTIQS